MKKISLILILIFVVSSIIYSQEKIQGDLSFNNQSNLAITVTVESETIPFEGLNKILENNRAFEIQNGVIFRQYDQYLNYYEWQVAKHTFIVNPNLQFVMNFCSGNPDPDDPYMYGYGKYKVTITTPNNVVYISYFNNLDSKYGTTINGLTYGNDFYYGFYNENQPVEFWGNSNPIYGYVYPQPNNIPEFKVWEIIYNDTIPKGNEFYARTTPFGYRPNVNNTYRESASIGTRVILDHVYNNTLNTKYGYNTLTDYYNNPVIPSGENDPGHTYMTPANVFDNDNFGTEFYAEPGSIFELKENIKFWISSVEYANGDKLRLKHGSHLIMGPGAKIQTHVNGKFIDEGSIKELSSGTVFRAWQNSTIELTGNEITHTFNNS
ncbi:MAG TPA: hypothetical protein VIK14_18195, partial [Ignavibacteria bacterium]